MKKLILLLFVLFIVQNIKAQFALASYHAVNTKVYSAVDGSMEFSPTYTSGTPNNNQYLSIPASSNYEFTDDFTVECWINLKNVTSVYQSFLGHYVSGTPWLLQVQPGGSLRLTGAYGADILSSILSINTWYHIALVRSGKGTNCLKIYVNGQVSGQATITGTIGNAINIFTVGSGDASGNDRFNGFISNIRIVKGAAVYTSNFTPPTSGLTDIGGTTLLLNTTYDAKYLKDNSSNGSIITNRNGGSTTTGLATSSPLNPFKFVSDGLLVNLDATDASSYSGSGSTWTNLGTGGFSYNATLTNSPAFKSGDSAYLYFNKPTSGDLQQYGTISINTGATNAWSMEAIVKVSNKGLWTTTPFISIADRNGFNQSGAYIGVQGGTFNFSPAGENIQSYQFANDTWYVITVVYSSNLAAHYVNGVLQGIIPNPSNNNSMGMNTINPMYFGNPPTNTSTTIQQVKISRYKFYNKALSASEISSNYNAQKTRFGL